MSPAVHHRILPIALLVALAPASAQDRPPLPLGLWQSTEDGFVVRIEPCGEGFCGFAAAPPRTKDTAPQGVCGQRMLIDFRWSAKAKRWEGRMQPPGAPMTMDSSIDTDGKTFVTLRARMLLRRKTMTLVPFAGALDLCRIAQ